MSLSTVSTPPPGDSGLAGLVLAARLLGLPVDPGQVLHRFGIGHRLLSETELLRAARDLGLRAAASTSRWERLGALPLPALAALEDGRYVLLARADMTQVLVQDPFEGQPATLPRDAFEARWNGRILLLTRRAPSPPEERRFDLRWFLPAVLRHRHLMGEVLLASFFIQIFALLTPLFFQVVIDKVLVHKGLTTLHVLAVGMVTLILFDVLLNGLRAYLLAHTSARIDALLGARVFRHLLRLPVAYFQARRVGDTVARVRELETIREFLTGSTLTLIIDVLFTVVFLAVMWLYSPLLTLVVLATLPLYLGLSLGVTPVLRARLQERFRRGAENQAFLVETVHGIETVKAMAVEPTLQRRWEDQLAAYVGASFRAQHLGNLAGQGAALVSKLTTVGILWVGAHLVITGDLSVGQLIAFNMLAGRVSGPILRLVQLWHELQQAGLSVERLGDLLNTPGEPVLTSGRSVLPAIRGQIQLDRVSFRYRPEAPPVLQGLSLDIPAGQVLGIVGRSGSGKSTIARLIQRLHVPEAGRIRIDGVDLAQTDPSWVRRQVGVVLQESVLFSGSVRDNIALAEPGMDMARVVEAARLAGAHEFILGLPEGYDTLVGENGARLSGGQRQRIAIARTLAPGPRVLILDEATSALDYESEAAVQKNMAGIARGRTVLIIAHRLSSVRRAHRIVVIEGGMIIEAGTHQELLARNGQYARLHRHQEGSDAAA